MLTDILRAGTTWKRVEVGAVAVELEVPMVIVQYGHEAVPRSKDFNVVVPGEVIASRIFFNLSRSSLSYSNLDISPYGLNEDFSGNNFFQNECARDRSKVSRLS